MGEQRLPLHAGSLGMTFPKQTLSRSREVEEPRGHPEWPQFMFVTSCPPFVWIDSRRVSFMSALEAHLSPPHSPRNKSSSWNHLLVSVLIFLPTCGSGLQPVQLGQGRDRAVLGTGTMPWIKHLGKGGCEPALLPLLLPTGKCFIPQWEEIQRAACNPDPCTGENSFS